MASTSSSSRMRVGSELRSSDSVSVAVASAAWWQPRRPTATACACSARKKGRLGGAPASMRASPRSQA
eukprot:1937450-Prymnesium_polylepis.1